MQKIAIISTISENVFEFSNMQTQILRDLEQIQKMLEEEQGE